VKILFRWLFLDNSGKQVVSELLGLDGKLTKVSNYYNGNWPFLFGMLFWFFDQFGR
jgi:hypothetical protein